MAAMVGADDFVGRTDARDDLVRVISRAEAGQGGFVVVTGEPGIGKTSLVERATRETMALWGRATETAVVPLGLWRQVVQAGADAGIDIDPDVASARSRPRASTAGTGYDRFIQFDAVIGGLREASRARPFVVVLDDLQWA